MRRVGPVVLLLLTAVLHVVPASALVTTDAKQEPLLQTVHWRVQFSPNGDGRKDAGRIRFLLSKSAWVKLVVRSQITGEVVRGPVRLGRLARGEHLWRWDGKRDGGGVVPDGTYPVMVTATRGERKQTVNVANATVVTTMDRGSLVTTRLPVYPQANQVADRVLLVYLFPGWDYLTEFHADGVPRVVFEIRSGSGDVVRRGIVKHAITPTFAWYARRRDGSAMPAGDYRARMIVHDGAGNRQVFKRQLTVSHEQLIEDVFTDTLASGQTRRFRVAEEDYCAATPSDRFPDGLSFRPCWFDGPTRAYFTHSVPFAAAPADSFRVSVTGGPTEPGTTDQGYIYGPSQAPTYTVPGDGTTRTPWQTPDLNTHPFLPGLSDALWWSFSTESPDSYDVDTFTVEYRHYCEAADEECLNP